MFTKGKMKLILGLLVGGTMVAAVACGGDDTVAQPQIIRETVIVEQTVVVTEKGDTVVETVVVEKEVKGDTVVVTATAIPAPPTQAPEGLIQAPDPKTPAGMAVVAISGNALGGENGRNAAQSSDSLKNWGIAETLFRRAPDDTELPWLATSFTISPDLSSATVKIKQGVSFQVVDGNDFGNMTASDVAFSMNDANSVTNPASIHGQAGDFAGLWGEWTAVDDETITFDFSSFDSTWKDDFVNQSGQAFSVLSERAFNEMGEEWVRDNIVATGVYQVEEWLRDESFTMVARPNHHLFTAKTERIQVLQVTEPSTRLSLLRNGQIDATILEPKDAAKLDLTEFTQTSTGGASQFGLFFSGNLWEDVYAGGDKKGEPLPPKATFVHDIPWIGKPGASHGADDLQQAKDIRRALALAIDKELINETLVGGLGRVVEVQYFSTSSPNWDDKYAYPYDPDGAAALIMKQDADYQRGSAPKDGPLGANAFEIAVYSTSASPIGNEIADAVAGFWQDIGLTTFSLKYAYATFRPTVVGRSNTIPWITGCDKGKESNPWHFPKGLVQTSLTRGGFSCGFESPVILDLYQRMATAPDTATATIAANEYLAYVYDQTLQPGVVAVPNDYFFNNKKIKSWPMDKAASSDFNSFWDLELQ